MRCWMIMSLVAMLSAPALAQQAKLKITAKETSLGKMPPGSHADKLVFSADGQHVTYPVKKGKTGPWYVMLDSAPQKEYEWIQPATLVLSETNAKVGYFLQKGENQSAVIDGVEGKEYREVRDLVLSPDGSRHAYIALPPTHEDSPATELIILDGKESSPYPKIIRRSPIFSPDGKHFAYAYEIKKQQIWVLDGKEFGPFDQVGPLRFSPDSSRWGFMFERGGKTIAMIDGKESKSFDRARGIVFSPDSKRVGFSAGLGKEYFVVVDGVEGAKFEFVGECVFSGNSQRVAFQAMRARRWMVMVFGETDEPRGYDRVGEPILSHDGKTLAHLVIEKKKWMMVVNGEIAEKEYDLIGTIAMSTDGKRLAYAARINDAGGTKDYCVIDGKEFPGAGRITISPDGKFVSHHTDEKPNFATPEDSFERRPHSRLWINDTPGPTFSGFPKDSIWKWTAPNRLQFFAGKNNELIKVEVEITE